MKEVNGNLWDYRVNGYYIVVPTNGFVKKNGEAVMGRGVARELAIIDRKFPCKLGKAIKERGNRVFVWNDNIITFPVKHNWWEKANLELIEKSCKELKEILDNFEALKNIAMPRVGCGNGKLLWVEVKPIIEYYLGDKVLIVDNESSDPVRTNKI